MSVRLLHLADLHLGARFPMFGGGETQRQADFLSAFERAVEYAVDPGNRLDAVLLAGDVFDRPDPPAALVTRVKHQCRRLADAELPVYWIPGTHDALDSPHCVYRNDDFPGVTLFTDPAYGTPHRLTIRDEVVAVSGFGWQQKRTPRDVLNTLSDVGPDVIHVALLHGTVQDNLEWTVKDHMVPITREALARAPAQYVALGHYHNPKQYPTGRGIAYYPGTLEGRRFGENGQRCLTVVDVDRYGARLETHPWNLRELRDEIWDLDTTPVGEGEDLAARLRGLGNANAIVRLTLRGTPEWEVDADALQAATEDAFFHLAVRDETDAFNAGRVADFARERSIRGEFVRRLRDRMAHADGRDRAVLALALKLGVHEFDRHARPAG